MKCPITGQNCSNIKHFDVSEVVNGKTKCFRLCSQCANIYFNTPELVFFNNSQQIEKTTKMGECPNCKLTLEQIKKMGRLGCLYCHQHFGKDNLSFLDKGTKNTELSIIDQKIDGETLNSYIQRLNKNLEIAVGEEKFEIAASLQKKIEQASQIKKEKSKLDMEFDIALESGQFEKAEKIKTNLFKIMKNFMSKQE